MGGGGASKGAKFKEVLLGRGFHPLPDFQAVLFFSAGSELGVRGTDSGPGCLVLNPNATACYLCELEFQHLVVDSKTVYPVDLL